MEHGSKIHFLRGKDFYLPKIINEPFENQLLEQIPFTDYLAKRDAISSSGLRKVLESPRHYLAWIVGQDEEDTDYFRFGRAAHMMLLEPEEFKKRYIVMPDFGDMRSSKNRTNRDAWLAQQYDSTVVVTQKEQDELVGMANAIMDHDVASGIMKNCKTEMTGYFVDPETKILCKIRPDIIHQDDMGLHIYDYKTTSFIRGAMGDVVDVS